MTTRRANASKRRERLSAAIDALAAAVPGGALMVATDPADFLLAVRCHIEAAEERAARAERERDDAIAIRSCECGVKEACRLVRERDKASAEAARCKALIVRLLNVMDATAKRPVDKTTVRETILAIREAQELAGLDTTGINERLAQFEAMIQDRDTTCPPGCRTVTHRVCDNFCRRCQRDARCGKRHRRAGGEEGSVMDWNCENCGEGV